MRFLLAIILITVTSRMTLRRPGIERRSPGGAHWIREGRKLGELHVPSLRRPYELRRYAIWYAESVDTGNRSA